MTMKRFFQAAAVLAAAGLPAMARAAFDTVQFGYSDPEDGNVVALLWDQTTAGSVRVEVDGALIGTVEGGAGRNVVSVTNVPEGEHSFEVFQGTTSLGSLNQEVLPIPMISRVSITDCTQSNNPNECEIEVTGESDGPPVTYIDIFVDGQFAVQAIEEENATEFGPVTVPITTKGDHEIVAQWTMERDDPDNFRLGSFISIGSTTCSTTCPLSTLESYTPGVCNGSGAEPNLSSPIFGLNYLFASGTAPPCIQACDANDDGDVNVADMIYVLNFLFSGGPAPRAWTDRNGDAVPDPACVTAAAGEDCATSHASCSP
jgi:hypothetical protein